jgi:hypothetical protein
MIFGAEVLVSQCNGASSQILTLPTSVSFALDWDGDGRTDALAADASGALQVYQSLGNGVAPAVSTGISMPSSIWFYTTTDIDGDGLDDIVFAGSNGVITYGLHNNAGIPPDLATSFADGYGNSAKPSYVSLVEGNYVNSDPSYYPDATFPNQNYIGPLYTVSKVILSDPSQAPGATYNLTYTYYGAWINLQGRGFEGFAETRS